MTAPTQPRTGIATTAKRRSLTWGQDESWFAYLRLDEAQTLAEGLLAHPHTEEADALAEEFSAAARQLRGKIVDAEAGKSTTGVTQTKGGHNCILTGIRLIYLRYWVVF